MDGSGWPLVGRTSVGFLGGVGRPTPSATHAEREIGDLLGLREQLDSWNDGKPETDDDLEVGLLWLTPIFPSRSDHSDDVTDYRDVHPDLSTLQDVKDFNKSLNGSTASNDSTRRS